jgi:hypothetical protein
LLKQTRGLLAGRSNYCIINTDLQKGGKPTSQPEGLSKEWLGLDHEIAGFGVCCIHQQYVEGRGLVVFARVSYLGVSSFKLWPGDRLHRLRIFVVFLSSARQIPAECLQLSPHCLLLHPFRINYSLRFNSFDVTVHELLKTSKETEIKQTNYRNGKV